ncbi:trace amine-associated receptor 13c-like [Cololabis saira]|uniref:trace amine-associated receptor 13c-like n=1 Tax=Cololabis saira TaxID=129043 RepID=UPI002AD3FF05|nr:trace amine-associated receptor 13c-like [Cololabis saira]
MDVLEEVELCFPQLFNSSCKRPKHPRYEVILRYILLSSISLLTVTLNLLVIISILHFKQLHTPTNLIILSLAVSDVFVGLLMLFPILLISCLFFSAIVCVLYQIFTYIITWASLGNMVLISVDRYVAVCYPLQYSTKITQKRVRVCVCLCWSFSVPFTCLVLKDNLQQPGRFISCSGECVFVTDYIMGYIDLFLSFLCPVHIIIVLYLRVFIVAVSQARSMRSRVAAVQTAVRVTVQKYELKAAKTLGVVVLVFLMCLCPYFIFFLTASDTVANSSSATFVVVLFYFNSCLNPMIYAFFYPWFRKCLKYIVTLRILQPGSSGANIL